jgi:hypothetical protein
METLNELKRRFAVAFKRFSAETTELHRMQANVSEHDVTAWIHGMNAQRRRVSKVAREYKTVRLEYIIRLLPTGRPTETQGDFFLNNVTEQEVP